MASPIPVPPSAPAPAQLYMQAMRRASIQNFAALDWLPLSLLTAAQGHPMLVELKNGETLNGHLVSCDTYMNLTLREVVQTAPDGDRFWRLAEAYVRGNNIKYLRLPEEIIEVVKEQQAAQQAQGGQHGGRGDRGGRGFQRGRGGQRGGPHRGGRGGRGRS
ncbi:hypothetical protein EDC01DRAFT_778677 [Geopyxis carbonaria]|nr:hypothetical protein EDC01DRAFT_778677 [Geopyxis carbonaria]